MTTITPTRSQLLEQLAAAEKKLTFAYNQTTVADLRYDEACEKNAPQTKLNYLALLAGEAKARREVRWQDVDGLKAQLLATAL